MGPITSYVGTDTNEESNKLLCFHVVSLRILFPYFFFLAFISNCITLPMFPFNFELTAAILMIKKTRKVKIC